MEQTLSAAEARANFSQILSEAGYKGCEAIIQRNNKPVAVIIGYAQYQELLALRQQASEREARFAAYDQIRARNASAAPEQVEADVAKAVRAVRRRKR
jgi:prevent-host-death family protein